MTTRNVHQWVHESGYAAKVEICLLMDTSPWSPTIAPDDIAKLGRVQEALRAGNLEAAAKDATVFELAPYNAGGKNPSHEARGFAEDQQSSLKGRESQSGTIRTGIGGWVFEPWRETFYPSDLPKTRELEYAAGKLRTIEVNATYYGSQKPATFAKWAASVPDGFVFSLKGSRYVTNRKILAEAGDSIAKFLGQGIVELGDRLGPILWQFAPTKAFDADDFGAFLALLPAAQDGVPLRHAVEVRHPSFNSPEFVSLARKHAVPIVYADHATYPAIADLTGDFVYARLQQGSDEVETCYRPTQIEQWADRARLWAEGGLSDDLPRADDSTAAKRPRDVFVYFITEGKSRAPHGAMALQHHVA